MRIASSRSQNLRFYIVVAIALTLLFAADKYIQPQPLGERLIQRATAEDSWINNIVNRYYRPLGQIVPNFKEYLKEKEAYQAELQEAEMALLQTRQEMYGAEELAAENERLRRLLGASPRTNVQRTIAARVYGYAPETVKHSVMIDRGTQDGAFVGQVALDKNGIAGQVVDATDHTAELLLVTDSSNAIPVEIKRTGRITIAVGMNRWNKMSVRHITKTDDVREGDELISSGVGGRFPAGYPVAVVTKVVRDPDDLFMKVYARPTVNVREMNYVLLLWLV